MRTSSPRTRWVAALAAAAALALTLGACSAASPATAAAAKSGSKGLIGFSDRFIAGNTWLATLAKGIQQAGAAAGYTVQAQDAQGDIATQVAQIKNFITEGAKAVIFEPVDDAGDAPAIALLRQAHIPFVVVNDLVEPSLAKQAFCNVHDNAYQTSKLVGYDTAAAVAQRYHAGQTVKLWVNAIFPHEIVTETRQNGFMSGWNSYWQTHSGGPTTTRIPDQYGHALPDIDLPVVRNVLTANPDLGAMFNETDTTMPSVLTSLHNLGMLTPAGNSKIIIGTFDAGMSTVQLMMNKPNFGIVADGLNQPLVQGAWAVEEAVAAINHHAPVDCAGSPPERILPSLVVTPQNAKTYYNPAYVNAYEPSLLAQALAVTKQLERS